MSIPNVRSIFILLLFTSFLVSCKTEAEKNKTIIEETVKTVKSNTTGDAFRDRLKAQEPATESQLKDWLPKSIYTFRRTEFMKIRGSQSDIATAGAIYSNGDINKKLEIKIADGASKDGLLAIQSHYMAQTLELNNVKPSKYEKTYEKNGLKVLETYVQKDAFYRVSFLYDMRFGITIESTGLTYEELWEAIGALELNKLIRL
ncbi:hypothetical protein G5B37_04700 [Rasiella rasia]|uniref:Lipoprotein n=1 Tax=Rasiella rasia TaxID=2744027 RepID=A0A6G6GJY2_9FLAO|nr:hypothetical protein [Rasiella rasia]QIE58885.1 hypothetical protein G5B37_04700 [Rasiella rasia]